MFESSANSKADTQGYEQIREQSIRLSGEMTNYNKHVIDERNVHLKREILARSVGLETVFVAVGASHLAGPKGLIDLLNQEGYIECN